MVVAVVLVVVVIGRVVARTDSGPSQQHFHPKHPACPASQRGHQLILPRVVH